LFFIVVVISKKSQILKLMQNLFTSTYFLSGHIHKN
jgi:hypothetical protein